jgi:hypothetical protein
LLEADDFLTTILFLLQRGAKLSRFEFLVLTSLGSLICIDRCLQIVRLAIANGSDFSTIHFWATASSFELIFNAISAHPDSVPDWEILADMLWNTRVQFISLCFYNKYSQSLDTFDVAKDTALWFSSMKRLHIDVQSLDITGANCWSSFVFDFWRSSQNYHHPTIQDVFRERVKGLIALGADPCQLNGRGITATILIVACFWSNAHERWVLEQDIHKFPTNSTWDELELFGNLWISALAAANTNVNAIVRHSFRLCHKNYKLLQEVHNTHCILYDCPEEFQFQSTPLFKEPEDLRFAILTVFKHLGIYPDESWWLNDDDKPNEWEMSATGVDFTPQTMHSKPTGEEMEIKRRKPRDFEE